MYYGVALHIYLYYERYVCIADKEGYAAPDHDLFLLEEEGIKKIIFSLAFIGNKQNEYHVTLNINYKKELQYNLFLTKL